MFGKAWIIDEKKGAANTEDVYDGKVYQSVFNEAGQFYNSITSNEKHISFQLNTDSVSLLKSTKFDIWLLYLTINELPPSLR